MENVATHEEFGNEKKPGSPIFAEAAAGGTPPATEDWKACFSELAPGLVLFARQWVRSAADAEDVVQEAFVRFWRRNLSIKNRALLYAAVRSAALDLIRRDNRRARREVEVFSQAERTVQPQFEQLDDSKRKLVAALDRLPRDQREVLVMKIWNELTFAEIGEALGISQNTAASRYRYGLGNLKKTLRPGDQPDAASASAL